MNEEVDLIEMNKEEESTILPVDGSLDAGPFYHGTKAALKMGDLLEPMEPTGMIENDPNLTDKKFPGNPTRSYRTRQPLRVVGEVLDWEGHAPEVLQNMRDLVAESKRLGIETINE